MPQVNVDPKDQLVMGAFSGFLEAFPKVLTDWMHGGETGIVNPTVRNSSDDWRPDADKITFKTQLMKVDGVSHGDTDACTDFSVTNNVSVQLDYLIANGQIDPNGLVWLQSNGYFDSSGKLNLSPRYTAVVSKTDPHTGNSLPNVWNAVRHFGCVPESVWPMPTDALRATIAAGGNIEALWADYYAAIPQEVIDLGKKFVSWFNVEYEWVVWPGSAKADFPTLLKQSPLQIATAVCSGWNSGQVINGCGAGGAHATTLLFHEPNGDFDILDHYVPYMKQFAANYDVTYAIRGIISSKVQIPQKIAPFTYNYQTNLMLGMPAGAEVKALQQGLQTILDANGKPYLMPGVFGPFGPQTQNALARFQVDHGVPDAPQGHDFGPQSREALSIALAQWAQAQSNEPLPRPLSADASSQE